MLKDNCQLIAYCTLFIECCIYYLFVESFMLMSVVIVMES